MLTAEQRRRYSRNILLPEIGKEGQEKLLAADVVVIGCGALGSIVAMYLAGSGVGHITICDFDTIDVSNLQRQLSFTTASLGKKKVEETADRLRAINPEIEITTFDRLVTTKNAPELFAGKQLIIEGSDNPATKHLVATTCRSLGLPYIIGGVREWEGQIITSLPGQPDYLDIFPEPAEAGGFTPCSIGGVAGPLPGVIGSMQAIEAIKYLTGAGSLLASRMLIYDALTATVKTFTL